MSEQFFGPNFVLAYPFSALSIRRAVPADGERVRNFVFSTLRSYNIEPDPGGVDAPVVAFGTAGGDGSALEWVAEIDGTVVGAIALLPRAIGELTVFYVDAPYRGIGIGRSLLEHVLKEAKARRIHQLHLETNTAFGAALHLYETTGWVRGPDLPSGYGPDRTYSLQVL